LQCPAANGADKRAIFTACSKAQAAADYLRGLALRDQQTATADARVAFAICSMIGFGVRAGASNP
jgi:antirestriction protein ArdC